MAPEVSVGKDIKPLWDLTGEGFWSNKYLYKAPTFNISINY